ncbi:MAG: response regulator transcription factor [Myxococcota bacterium]|nr:response regulator transcription factor [Myxococcota bacterium]
MRALVVDDHGVMRAGLRSLLESRDDVTLVGEAKNGHEAIEQAERLKPELILMDIELPGLSGILAAEEITRQRYCDRILMLSAHETRNFVESALRAGARGYVVKTSSAQELQTAIDAVCSGRCYMSPAVTHHAVGAVADPAGTTASPISSLSRREQEVLRLIADGMGNKEIADELHLSPRTIETHRANLMRKLGVRKVSGLVRIAIREGLLSA